LFVVPTIGFRLLYALVIVRLARRELVWINVTAHPTADWITQQITEAFPWDEADLLSNASSKDLGAARSCLGSRHGERVLSYFLGPDGLPRHRSGLPVPVCGLLGLLDTVIFPPITTR
jgi:hypothetical protein